MMIRSVFFSLLLLCQLAQASDELLSEAYQCQHQDPAALIETLQTLYPEAKFSSREQLLLIRAPQQLLVEISKLLPQLDSISAQYRLYISSSPQGDNYHSTHSSNSIANSSYPLTRQQPLLLSRQQRDSALKGQRWWWGQVEKQPLQQQSLEIILLSANENQLSIQYRYQQAAGGRDNSNQNQLQMEPGQWYPLHNKQSSPTNGGKQWSSNSGHGELYIKIESI